jgi:hypothetical protein
MRIDRVKGCVLLQIEINKNQYLSLKNIFVKSTELLVESIFAK